jgi:hypothetical protein
MESPPKDERDKSITPTAMILGLFGVLIPPLALVGWVLGLVAIRQTNVERRAQLALLLNSIVAAGWGMLMLLATFGGHAR